MWLFSNHWSSFFWNLTNFWIASRWSWRQHMTSEGCRSSPLQRRRRPHLCRRSPPNRCDARPLWKRNVLFKHGTHRKFPSIQRPVQMVAERRSTSKWRSRRRRRHCSRATSTPLSSSITPASCGLPFVSVPARWCWRRRPLHALVSGCEFGADTVLYHGQTGTVHFLHVIALAHRNCFPTVAMCLRQMGHGRHFRLRHDVRRPSCLAYLLQ